MKLPIPRFLRPAPKYARSSARHVCQIDCSMMLIDRMTSFEGRLTDISRGGGMFRPKLAYLMYRRDVPICLSVGGEELFGHIVNTTPGGFSIRFDDLVDEEDIVEIVENYSTPVKVAA